MPRHRGSRFTLIIVILALLGGVRTPKVTCYETYPISGRWISFNSLVDKRIDNMTLPDGGNSVRFAVKNYTGQMSFGYVFEESMDLSKGEFLVFWIRVQEVVEKHSYFLVLDDDQGRKRGFWDLVGWFDLEEMTWGRLVIDPSNFRWEDDDFDPTGVKRCRFDFSGGESRYSQVVWLADLALYEDDKPVNQENEEDRGPSLILGMLLTVSLALIAGFVTLRLIGFPAHDRASWVVMMPIYFVFGLSSIALAFRLLALFRVDALVVSGFIASLIAIFVLLIKNRCKGRLRSLRFRPCKDVSTVLPLILMAFSFVRFASLAVNIGWAPLFDSMAHGNYISLILYHNRVPSSTYPVGNMSLDGLLAYPMGFHVVGALVSMISGLYPGEAILVILVAVMMFLPSLLFSTIYIGTGSLELSFIAYLLAYFLPGGEPVLWQPSHDLLMGNFLMGTHPNLFGNAVLLTFFPMALILDQTRESRVRKIMAYAVLTMALAVIYYPLLPYALLFCVLAILEAWLRRSRMTPFGVAEIVLACMIVAASYVYLNQALGGGRSAFEIYFAEYMEYQLFSPTSPYLVYTASVFLALPLSLYLLGEKKTVKPAMMFWVLFFPLMISQNKDFFVDFLWFTMPDRVLILLAASSYLVIMLAASKLFEDKVRNRIARQVSEGRIRFSALRVLFALVVLLLLAPSIFAHVSYSYPTNLQTELPHGNDLAAMRWLCENSDSEDLILNFPLSTIWLPSLKAMNVVNDYTILRNLNWGSLDGTWLASRTTECNQMISHPWDYGLTRELASRYGLKYVYVGEGNPDAAIIIEGERIAPVPGPILLSREQRLAMYMLNPHLEVAYRAGNAVVFRVKSE